MKITQTAKTIGTALVAIAILVVVLTHTFGLVTEQAATGIDGEGALTTQGGTGQLAVDAGASIAAHQSVQTSLGTAVKLEDGATVTVDGDIGVNTQAEQWTVCTFAKPGAKADNVTSTVYKYEDAALIHNGTSGEYRGYFFDKGNRSAVDAAVAVNGTDTQKLLCLSRDDATLTLTRNNTASDSVQLDSDANVAPPPNTGFNGTVEETRIYPRTLTATNKSTIVGEPTGAIEGPAPAMRLMYDARSPSQTTYRAFFTGETADASGAAIVDSFKGKPIERGVDYRWGGTQNATLTVLDGGELRDTGEIVYATWSENRFGGLINRLISVGTTAFSIITLGLLVLAGRKVSEFVGDSGF